MNVLRCVHKDEEGIETLQAVMIIAVAAVILALVKSKWPDVKTWFNKALQDITGFTQ
jgi:hypothetical protein